MAKMEPTRREPTNAEQIFSAFANELIRSGAQAEVMKAIVAHNASTEGAQAARDAREELIATHFRHKISEAIADLRVTESWLPPDRSIAQITEKHIALIAESISHEAKRNLLHEPADVLSQQIADNSQLNNAFQKLVALVTWTGNMSWEPGRFDEAEERYRLATAKEVKSFIISALKTNPQLSGAVINFSEFDSQVQRSRVIGYKPRQV